MESQEAKAFTDDDYAYLDAVRRKLAAESEYLFQTVIRPIARRILDEQRERNPQELRLDPKCPACKELIR